MILIIKKHNWFIHKLDSGVVGTQQLSKAYVVQGFLSVIFRRSVISAKNLNPMAATKASQTKQAK